MQILAAASLILFLCSCVLFVRSFFVSDGIVWVADSPRERFIRYARCSRGGLLLYRTHEQWEVRADPLIGNNGIRYNPRRPGGYPRSSAGDSESAPHWRFGSLGFEIVLPRRPKDRWNHISRTISVTVPLPALMLAFFPLAVLGVRSWIRHLRGSVAGLCPHCGYDLRASPERCPECGTAARKPTTAAAKRM